MALPTSGPLSIDDIRNELGSTSGSLQTLSQLAGFSQPHRISDFYGYSSAVNVAYEFYVTTDDNAWLDTAYASGAINQFHRLEITVEIRFRGFFFFLPDIIETRVLAFASSSSSYSPRPTNPPGNYYTLDTVEIIGWNFTNNPQNINILNIAILN